MGPYYFRLRRDVVSRESTRKTIKSITPPVPSLWVITIGYHDKELVCDTTLAVHKEFVVILSYVYA